MIMLSAGAVAPGLTKIIDMFQRQSGVEIKLTFATAPEIRGKLAAHEYADVVIAPAPLLDELVKAGSLSKRRIPLGRIGVGLFVRDHAPLPPIGDTAELTQALLQADRIIYNQASTGSYIDSLFPRLGIADKLAAKIIRYPDFAAVRDHIAKGYGNEIGFGATTVIIENTGKGVQFAGPLPAALQNFTAYAAAASLNAREDAAGFLDHLATPATQALLRSTGIL